MVPDLEFVVLGMVMFWKCLNENRTWLLYCKDCCLLAVHVYSWHREYVVFIGDWMNEKVTINLLCLSFKGCIALFCCTICIVQKINIIHLAPVVE